MKYLLALSLIAAIGATIQTGCTSTSSTIPGRSSDITLETFHANNSHKIITAHNHRNSELWGLSLSINEQWKAEGIWKLELTPIATPRNEGPFSINIDDFSIFQGDGKQLRVLKYADLFKNTAVHSSKSPELDELTKSNPALSKLLGQDGSSISQVANDELKRDYVQSIDAYPGVPLHKHYFIFEAPSNGQSFITLRFRHRGKQHDVKFPI